MQRLPNDKEVINLESTPKIPKEKGVKFGGF